MDAVNIKDVTFSYDGEKDVLNGISLRIPKGSYTTIIGHNGSGKSTIARLMMGLLEPKSGEIEILGKTMNEENVYELRDRMGIVFQNPDNQFIGSTVADDIAFGLENHCVPQENMQAIVEEAASRVGMSDYLDAEPTRLSGGQKQRVAIAGILAIEPDLIIFDESTSMLDPQGKKSINDQIRRLHDEKDITILSITHDMEEVAQSDYVVVLKDGKAVLSGTPAEIFAHEKELKDMQLDVPFAWKFSQLLEEKGLFTQPSLSLEDTTERLCQLK